MHLPLTWWLGIDDPDPVLRLRCLDWVLMYEEAHAQAQNALANLGPELAPLVVGNELVGV